MNKFFRLFKRCKHEWKIIDRHCLGMNPPTELIYFECKECGKIKTEERSCSGHCR